MAISDQNAKIHLQKSNLEIVKRNSQLQIQLNHLHQQFSLLMRDNLELSRQVQQLKDKLRSMQESEAAFKQEILERVDSLEMIASHIGDLAKLLAILVENRIQEELPENKPAASIFDIVDIKEISTKRKKRRRIGLKDKSNLEPISE